MTKALERDDGGAALELDVPAGNQSLRPMSDVGDGWFTGFAVFAAGFAKPECGLGVSVGDCVNIHVYTIKRRKDISQSITICYCQN